MPPSAKCIAQKAVNKTRDQSTESRKQIIPSLAKEGIWKSKIANWKLENAEFKKASLVKEKNSTRSRSSESQSHPG
jgi:hypothetical protein